MREITILILLTPQKIGNQSDKNDKVTQKGGGGVNVTLHTTYLQFYFGRYSLSFRDINKTKNQRRDRRSQKIFFYCISRRIRQFGIN